VASDTSHSSKHDHGMSRHSSSGLLKNTKERVSKQAIMGSKMFGSRMGKHGKDLQIGKMFRKKGKGIMKSMKSLDSHAINPSVEEFDDMLAKSTGTSKKKSMFSRKQFG
jgi:hypothetical protein